MVDGDVLPIGELAGRARCAGETHVGYGSTALGIRVVAAHRDPAVAEFAASAPNAIEHSAPSPRSIFNLARAARQVAAC